ncbi:MAG: hypothetical protein GX196_02415, partial [Clostridiaceae bacterium]|nr:hypothetical protein [Clostridiaceae bacterium]
MFKKVVSLLLIVMMAVGFFQVVTADDDIVYRGIKIEVDGIRLSPKDANGNPVEPFIKGGYTYLPLRALANALGLAVEWDGDTKTVILGEKKPYTETDDGKVKVYLNGQKLNLNPEAIIIAGSTYLPVRAVSEAFGKEVNWIDETSTVVITTPKTQQDQQQQQQQDNTPAQVAKFDTTKTYKILLKDTDKALTVKDASTENSVNMTFVKFTGAPEQVWKFEAIGENYVLVNVNSNKALDIPALSTDEGVLLIQWDKSGDINQQFKIVKNQDGTYSIIAAVSGLYLEGASGDLVQAAKRQ